MSEHIKMNTGTPPVKHWCQYEQRLCEYANSWGMCSITACISKTRKILGNVPSIDMSDDAISRERILKELNAESEKDYPSFRRVMEKIEDAPPVEPKRSKGKWQKVDYAWECDRCHCRQLKKKPTNFCPNCGALMDVKLSYPADGFDSLIPPEDGEIYINNKGATLMSVNTLMEIWEHPKMKDRVFEKLEDVIIGEYGSEEKEHE